ncbi:hypothetical protein [Streptomyces sp. NPDC006134]|uniref:hypothetical protein n=1 Tax=Streptomyces sp. NPDC006134 TaxID=3154467 RepID=UPI00340B3AA6
MTTDTPATPHHCPGSGTAPPPPDAAVPRPWGPRGRHRRPPRPRRLLLGAGGLALAAGALSLVRIVPDPGTGGSDTAQAAPSHPVTDPAPVTAPVPGGGTAPGAGRPSPSATSAMGGLRASTAPGRTPAPAPDGTTPDAGNTGDTGDTGKGTTIPHLPNTPNGPDGPDGPDGPSARGPSAAPGEPDGARPPAPRPPHSELPSPRPPSAPAPAPPRPTPSPEPDRPGLCVPVIDLCLDFRGGDD